MRKIKEGIIFLILSIITCLASLFCVLVLCTKPRVKVIYQKIKLIICYFLLLIKNKDKAPTQEVAEKFIDSLSYSESQIFFNEPSSNFNLKFGITVIMSYLLFFLLIFSS